MDYNDLKDMGLEIRVRSMMRDCFNGQYFSVSPLNKLDGYHKHSGYEALKIFNCLYFSDMTEQQLEHLKHAVKCFIIDLHKPLQAEVKSKPKKSFFQKLLAN